MNIKKFIIFGMLFTILYILIYIVLFYLIPENEVFELFSELYNKFVPETMWINIYSLLLLTGAMIVNVLLFYVVFFAVKKMKSKSPKRIS